LRRVRTQMMSARLYRADSVFEQADELGRLAMLGLAADARSIDAKLAAITAEQVKDVASRYFGDDTMTVAVLLPESEDEDVSEANPEADPEDINDDTGDTPSGARQAEGDSAQRAMTGTSSMSRNGRDV